MLALNSCGDRLGSEEGRPIEDTICKLYRRAYGREPDPFELTAATSFLRTRDHGSQTGDAESAGDARDEALIDLCHVLLNSNEFIYLD